MDYIVHKDDTLIAIDTYGNKIEHYGMSKRSGRYPYGSGKKWGKPSANKNNLSSKKSDVKSEINPKVSPEIKKNIDQAIKTLDNYDKKSKKDILEEVIVGATMLSIGIAEPAMLGPMSLPVKSILLAAPLHLAVTDIVHSKYNKIKLSSVEKEMYSNPEKIETLFMKELKRRAKYDPRNHYNRHA